MKRAAALAVGAAGFAFYHAQVPTSQLYGATICRNRDARGLIALTYDDGPNPRFTESLLSILERHGARATFFLIGKWTEREPALAREVQAAGHAIGNHTFGHPTLALCSGERVQEELRRCAAAVEDAGVSFSSVDGAALMRPPWGRRRPGTLRAIRSAGYAPVIWSVTGWDWRKRETADSIARRCSKAKDGDVILLHDGVHTEPAGDRAASVGATAQILERLGAEGYRFVTVPELMAARAAA
ncbi:MAG TPA: polysaccharide deacetylase family protein [Thermoleophilaceae bacterium]|jgi:peptidoglycan/xylan/chitin deacetylase (PgdA/CDA1 family)|nr:polysaccharide deacetylase family protein [Thermoleophilaceae bacterium]